MRKAFTLIELLISIVILSVLMLFLYKSYASLNRTNATYAQELQKLQKSELLKKVIYIDLSTAIKKSVKIIKQDTNEDVLYLQTPNSIHNRINPYVAYIMKEKKLYRLESLKEFKSYPLDAQSEFVADELAEVTSFRVYPSKDSKKALYLVHIVKKDKSEVLLKIKALNG